MLNLLQRYTSRLSGLKHSFSESPAAKIPAKLVKELRDMTGAPLMDCKKALEATAGDISKSKEFLREKNLIFAAKKEGNESLIGLYSLNLSPGFDSALLASVNSETDFVSKNQEFIAFSQQVSSTLHQSSVFQQIPFEQTSCPVTQSSYFSLSD